MPKILNIQITKTNGQHEVTANIDDNGNVVAYPIKPRRRFHSIEYARKAAAVIGGTLVEQKHADEFTINVIDDRKVIDA